MPPIAVEASLRESYLHHERADTATKYAQKCDGTTPAEHLSKIERFEIRAEETHEWRTNAHPSETIHFVRSIAAAAAAAPPSPPVLDSGRGMRSEIDQNQPRMIAQAGDNAAQKIRGGVTRNCRHAGLQGALASKRGIVAVFVCFETALLLHF